MTVTREEEIVLLYTLYVCGRRPSKHRATHFIISNHFFRERERDYDDVKTGESRIENRIAWIRQNLKSKGELSMPQVGTWAITGKGIERIEKTAIRSVTWEDDVLLDIFWERFSPTFLERLKTLGRTLRDKNAP